MNPNQRHLAVLVRKLSKKISAYNQSGTSKPEVSWTLLDLVTELNPEVVRLCENQCDYQFVLSLALSDLNKEVGYYLGNMEPGTFGRYCRERKRGFYNRSKHSRLEHELLALLLGIPRNREEYSVMMKVVGEHSPTNKLK